MKAVGDEQAAMELSKAEVHTIRIAAERSAKAIQINLGSSNGKGNGGSESKGSRGMDMGGSCTQVTMQSVMMQWNEMTDILAECKMPRGGAYLRTP